MTKCENNALTLIEAKEKAYAALKDEMLSGYMCWIDSSNPSVVIARSKWNERSDLHFSQEIPCKRDEPLGKDTMVFDKVDGMIRFATGELLGVRHIFFAVGRNSKNSSGITQKFVSRRRSEFEIMED